MDTVYKGSTSTDNNNGAKHLNPKYNYINTAKYFNDYMSKIYPK